MYGNFTVTILRCASTKHPGSIERHSNLACGGYSNQSESAFWCTVFNDIRGRFFKGKTFVLHKRSHISCNRSSYDVFPYSGARDSTISVGICARANYWWISDPSNPFIDNTPCSCCSSQVAVSINCNAPNCAYLAVAICNVRFYFHFFCNWPSIV